MSKVVLASIIFMTLSLLTYSGGVFWERKEGEVWPRHTILFGVGIAFNIVGVTIITVYTSLKSGEAITDTLFSNINIISGAVGVLLLAVHFVWAIGVVREGTDKQLEIFHKLSIIIWVLWLITYFMSLRAGITAGRFWGETNE
ncbi:MAG: TIGR03987 family protein [Eubacterium sp.]|nr:TIGR03987 family protein [Eubacterium sp.]